MGAFEYLRQDRKVAMPYTEIIRQTEKSVLVVIKGLEHWLPLSRVKIDGEKGLIQIPVWLCDKNFIQFRQNQIII